MTESRHSSDGHFLERAIEQARESEARLAGKNALEAYRAHATNVRLLNEMLRELGAPIKKAFAELSIDYQLARHALWIVETVDRHGEACPAIADMGPSVVLLIREADRRFEREGRPERLAEVMQKAASGTSRDALRREFLPPRRSPSPARVLAAIAGEHLDEARKLFAACSPAAQTRLRWLAHALIRFVDSGSLRCDTPGGSIGEEVRGLLASGYSE